MVVLDKLIIAVIKQNNLPIGTGKLYLTYKHP